MAPLESLRDALMRRVFLLACSHVRLFALLVLCAWAAPVASAGELSVTPRKVELTDAYSGRQLLVSGGGHDLTRSAHYASNDPKVARVDEHGYVTPVGDGSA